jgi:hypothetical protein
MGVFDHIYSHLPLPESNLSPDTAFQSKNLDCLLERYAITADGRLLRCSSIADTPLDLADPVDTAYHGDLRFYGHGPDGTWHEFVARFTDGKLAAVTRDREAEKVRRRKPPRGASA